MHSKPTHCPPAFAMHLQKLHPDFYSQLSGSHKYEAHDPNLYGWVRVRGDGTTFLVPAEVCEASPIATSSDSPQSPGLQLPNVSKGGQRATGLLGSAGLGGRAAARARSQVAVLSLLRAALTVQAHAVGAGQGGAGAVQDSAGVSHTEDLTVCPQSQVLGHAEEVPATDPQAPGGRLEVAVTLKGAAAQRASLVQQLQGAEVLRSLGLMVLEAASQLAAPTTALNIKSQAAETALVALRVEEAAWQLCVASHDSYEGQGPVPRSLLQAVAPVLATLATVTHSFVAEAGGNSFSSPGRGGMLLQGGRCTDEPMSLGMRCAAVENMAMQLLLAAAGHAGRFDLCPQTPGAAAAEEQPAGHTNASHGVDGVADLWCVAGDALLAAASQPGGAWALHALMASVQPLWLGDAAAPGAPPDHAGGLHHVSWMGQLLAAVAAGVQPEAAAAGASDSVPTAIRSGEVVHALATIHALAALHTCADAALAPVLPQHAPRLVIRLLHLLLDPSSVLANELAVQPEPGTASAPVPQATSAELLLQVQAAAVLGLLRCEWLLPGTLYAVISDVAAAPPEHLQLPGGRQDVRVALMSPLCDLLQAVREPPAAFSAQVDAAGLAEGWVLPVLGSGHGTMSATAVGGAQVGVVHREGLLWPQPQIQPWLHLCDVAKLVALLWDHLLPRASDSAGSQRAAAEQLSGRLPAAVATPAAPQRSPSPAAALLVTPAGSTLARHLTQALSSGLSEPDQARVLPNVLRALWVLVGGHPDAVMALGPQAQHLRALLKVCVLQTGSRWL